MDAVPLSDTFGQAALLIIHHKCTGMFDNCHLWNKTLHFFKNIFILSDCLHWKKRSARESSFCTIRVIFVHKTSWKGCKYTIKLFKTWPGKMRVGCKACHVMHSKYLVKINERAKAARKPFSWRPQRGDCAQSGIKIKFPSADNCSLACLLSSFHLPRPLLKTHTNCPGTQCV